MPESHESSARTLFRERILEMAERDERVVGLLTSGSASQGRVDEWSDLDVFLFIRDADFDEFVQGWCDWATQFGKMLLAYHPDGQAVIAWTIYHAQPRPLRVDFRLIRASEYDSVREWTTQPLTVESLVWYDDTGGKLRAAAQSLIDRSPSLQAYEAEAAFTQYCGRMWYFLHSAYCKLERGQQWYARVSFHMAVLDSLMALLKLEAGAVERWHDAFPEWNIENMISAGRLAQLNVCIPLPGSVHLKRAMVAAAHLGREVCENISMYHGWDWPSQASAFVFT